MLYVIVCVWDGMRECCCLCKGGWVVGSVILTPAHAVWFWCSSSRLNNCSNSTLLKFGSNTFRPSKVSCRLTIADFAPELDSNASLNFKLQLSTVGKNRKNCLTPNCLLQTQFDVYTWLVRGNSPPLLLCTPLYMPHDTSPIITHPSLPTTHSSNEASTRTVV